MDVESRAAEPYDVEQADHADQAVGDPREQRRDPGAQHEGDVCRQDPKGQAGQQPPRLAHRQQQPDSGARGKADATGYALRHGLTARR